MLRATSPQAPVVVRPALPESLQHVGQRFDGDPVQLDILAHGDVGDAAAVSFGEVRDGADLFASRIDRRSRKTRH